MNALHHDRPSINAPRLRHSSPNASQRHRATAAARVISITSGKGGVGKTTLAVNLGVLLARMEQRVLIIDADLGLANVDVMFGVTPCFNLNHYFRGEQLLESLLVTGPSGVQLLPAGSGIQQLTHLTPEQQIRFLDDVDQLHDRFDYVLIDTAAGISENVSYFNAASHQVLVVTTPEPTSVTDAYALMKMLSTQYHQKSFRLIVNQAAATDEGLDVYQKLTLVSSRYLDISIDYLGCIPAHPLIQEAVRKQKPAVDLYPGLDVTNRYGVLARELAATQPQPAVTGTLQFFWNHLLHFSQGGHT